MLCSIRSCQQTRTIEAFVRGNKIGLGGFTKLRTAVIPTTGLVFVCAVGTNQANAETQRRVSGARISGTRYTSATSAWVRTLEIGARTRKSGRQVSSSVARERARTKAPRKERGKAAPSTDFSQQMFACHPRRQALVQFRASPGGGIQQPISRLCLRHPLQKIAGARGRVLYLFSGPLSGLGKFVQDLGLDCTCMDIEISDSHNLLDQTCWDKVESNFDSVVAGLASPSCSTFTAARRRDGGPQPLRSATGPGRYGLKSLRAVDAAKVREGNALALRAYSMAINLHKRKKPWIVEQPHRRPGSTSMWNLDEFEPLLAKDDVFLYTFAQCHLAAAQRS